jgi:hypothetical protein
VYNLGKYILPFCESGKSAMRFIILKKQKRGIPEGGMLINKKRE